MKTTGYTVNTSSRASQARSANGFAVCALLSTLLLSACGFHLRGSEQAALPPTAVVGDAAMPLQVEIRRQLRAGGTEVTETAVSAQWAVRLLREESDRRVLSVGSTGKVEEYELYYAATVAFEDPQGKPLGPPQTVSQTRSYGFSESAVLGKDAEQETLMRDMRRDVANQILRRLRALTQSP